MLLRFPVLAAIVMLLAGSCTTVEPTTTSTPRTTSTTGAAFDPDAWARTYIVEVRSEGTFADDPLAGVATGLVVDEQGLIVVPATAVVGADRVNLTISGEEFPLEGSVEALAECSNLALVSVDYQFASAARLADSVGTASWFVWTSDGLWETSPAGSFEPSPWMIAIDANGEVISIASNAVGEVDAGHAGEVVNAMRRRELVGQLDFAGVDQPDGSVLVTGVRAGSPIATAGLRAGDLITKAGSAALVGGLAYLCEVYPSATNHIEFVREGTRYEGEVGVAAFHPASWRSVSELKEAVIRVETPGGSGSGFLVSSDGFVLTNYHVVAGETNVTVAWDGGERSLPGVVVGRSSCADLAIIEIGGSGHVFLEWSRAPVTVAQKVRAVGFPGGTSLLTFKPGEISKEEIDPFVNSPVTRSFEHSAQIVGGNSGGPIVNENGEVVGVTNAALPIREWVAQEPFAIHGADAAEYVPSLIAGDADHLGAHIGYYLDEEDLLQAEVLAVDERSLAGELGLFGDPELGDDINRIGDLNHAAQNLTIRGICDELEKTTDPIPIDVYRYTDDHRYNGELRGRLLEIIPDPVFMSSPGEVVGTIVPGRWTTTPLSPSDEVDFYGLRAGLPGFDFASNFGREPYLRLLVSLDLADSQTTEAWAAETDYSGHCRDVRVEEVVHRSLRGHRQVWTDCHNSFEIRNYALLDLAQDPSPMVLLLIVDDPYYVDGTASDAISDLVVSPYPAPPNEDDVP